MKEDVIDIIILDDGTIRSTTPKISAANHTGAHQFFQLLARLTGGKSESKGNHAHDHHHEHAHDHQKGSN